ncbi:2-succinyl-5-enolpyruvyl-6-hydroxy-3-cyclohexene-1-carboxylic-acid synthase [Teredinibacter purpureus]|uniref:2-succinyl-5-enolpyruvyl-6-hydroxy-3- cyclohexene-1-carboxylic-acid synthase n=1 Tax=Teredinibacter purpureus TaxID=2731756 RepID=UPI0005F87956|nr:2-succinyl-5-enolpyruvyl-6-hydroxy-3-cyclohexene-1-carboxylic-acid synthase [Teredinibacter purpureus]
MRENGLWAATLLRGCYEWGVRHICIAPGSRSAPLAIAAYYAQKALPGITLHTHFDERGLGFFALNLARVTESPTIIITTSGTAVANVHPAIIEAYETATPLWVLSADRTDDLLNCGANQAIQQKNVFGLNVLSAANFTVDSPIETLLGEVATTAGPIHLNCQFAEPLYLTREAGFLSVLRETDFSSKRCNNFSEKVENPLLSRRLDNIAAGNTIVVLGALTPSQALALTPWLQLLQCPIVADVASQYRFSGSAQLVEYADVLLHSPDNLALLQADCVVQFGGRIVSKRLNRWLAQREGEYWLFAEHAKNLDPTHKAMQYPIKFCEIDHYVAPSTLVHSGTAGLLQASRRVRDAVPALLANQWSEAGVCWALLSNELDNAAIFAGNSLSIRMLDTYCAANHKNSPIHTNRGASGIDGLVASAVALGWSKMAIKQIILIVGDTALLHDLNSLALAEKSALPLKIIVLNNNGGRIFGLLPAVHEAAYTELFVMPTEKTFDGACLQFGMAYQQANDMPSFKTALTTLLNGTASMMLECVFESDTVTTDYLHANLNALNVGL